MCSVINVSPVAFFILKGRHLTHVSTITSFRVYIAGKTNCLLLLRPVFPLTATLHSHHIRTFTIHFDEIHYLMPDFSFTELSKKLSQYCCFLPNATLDGEAIKTMRSVR